MEQEPLSTLVVQQELQTFDDLLLVASFHLQPLEIDPGSLQKRDWGRPVHLTADIEAQVEMKSVQSYAVSLEIAEAEAC